MSIEVMIGASVAGSEAVALRQLYRDLAEVDALLMVNFEVNHRQIDLMVATGNYAAVVELKCFQEPVFGDINGHWMLEDFAQQKKPHRRVVLVSLDHLSTPSSTLNFDELRISAQDLCRPSAEGIRGIGQTHFSRIVSGVH
jgi:hypothetical protein